MAVENSMKMNDIGSEYDEEKETDEKLFTTIYLPRGTYSNCR